MALKWMFHATAMGPSYDAILEPLVRLLGCRVLHDQASDVPGIERRGGMTWIADGSIEIGEPMGPTSPVQRFVDRFGGGMHSLAVEVDDLDGDLARAEAMGVRTADRPMPGVAFSRPGDLDGLLVEWHANRQADDPRWGADVAPAPPSVLDPQRFAYLAAVVADPAATGARLAELFQTAATPCDPSGRADAPAWAVGLGDCSLALFPMPEGSGAPWGAPVERPRFVAMAVTVDDLEGARAALAAAGHRVGDELADGSLVVHAGLPFPLVVASELLPGDPRRG